MCIGSTSSLLSIFLLALASFASLWNFTKIKTYFLKNIYTILNLKKWISKTSFSNI